MMKMSGRKFVVSKGPRWIDDSAQVDGRTFAQADGSWGALDTAEQFATKHAALARRDELGGDSAALLKEDGTTY